MSRRDQVAAASAHPRTRRSVLCRKLPGMGGLIYSASLTAGSLADRELGLRAEDLARYVSLDENQKPRLELPPPLKQAYSAAAQQSLFAIRDKDGRLVEASTPEIGAMIARWPRADSEPSYFRLSKFGSFGARLFGRQHPARQRGRAVIRNGRRGIGRQPAGPLDPPGIRLRHRLVCAAFRGARPAARRLQRPQKPVAFANGIGSGERYRARIDRAAPAGGGCADRGAPARHRRQSGARPAGTRLCDSAPVHRQCRA